MSEMTHAARTTPELPSWPDVPVELLLTHLEYASWAAERTLAMLDRLPSDAITRPVVNSFPTVLDTLRHICQWDQYYLTHLRGEHIALDDIKVPETYTEVKAAWRAVHSDLQRWAVAHLSDRKDVVLQGWAAWPTWMVIMQVANHASHHLGQVLTLIRQAGYSPMQADWTDLILLYLERFPVRK